MSPVSEFKVIFLSFKEEAISMLPVPEDILISFLYSSGIKKSSFKSYR